MNRRKVPAAAVRVEDRSTVEDRLPRNSCRQVCCVFVARAAYLLRSYQSFLQCPPRDNCAENSKSTLPRHVKLHHSHKY